MAAAPDFAAGQIVTVFRNRPRAEAAAEYADLAPRMQSLATAMPGFVDAKTFTAEDGERVTIATFADEDSQRAWRDQVDHRAAQQAGRDRIYATYTIQVCRTLRVGSHIHAGAHPLPADGADG
jgi:heme-degrading monooxygenase HmoA